MSEGEKMPDLFEYAAQKAREQKLEEEPTEAPSDSPPQRAEPRSSGRKRKPSAPPPTVVTPPRAEAASQTPTPGSREAPLAVAQVIRRAAHAIEQSVGTVWVEGEVSGLSRASSGHLYFNLVDKKAQVSCVFWRRDASRLRFDLEDGLVVRCRCKANIYPQSGKFQLYVGFAEPAGLGEEALALAQLKKKLEKEGLFERGRKKPIPRYPRRIGIVTSKSGAAIRDITQTVKRRFPVPILVADASVQGRSAPGEIVQALRRLSRCDVDVIIVGRGGGSSSDLSAWNDERVVRAVAECAIPIVSAVGHEVDISLCDLVADQRAATPTAAGELVVPVRSDLQEALSKTERRMTREIEVRIAQARQRLDAGSERLAARVGTLISTRRKHLEEAWRGLSAQHPKARIAHNKATLAEFEARVGAQMQRIMNSRKQDYSGLVARLSALSPLNVLERGYAIATDDDQRVLTNSNDIEVGSAVDLRLRRGTLHCTVLRKESPSAEPKDEQEEEN